MGGLLLARTGLSALATEIVSFWICAKLIFFHFLSVWTAFPEGPGWTEVAEEIRSIRVFDEGSGLDDMAGDEQRS